MVRMLRKVRMVEGSVIGHWPHDLQREPHAVVAASLAQANWDSQAMPWEQLWQECAAKTRGCLQDCVTLADSLNLVKVQCMLKCILQ